MKIEDVLLPADVRPVNYNVFLEPDLVKCTFEGHETIKLTVSSPTDRLVLHAHQLTLKEGVTVTTSAGKKLGAKKVSFDLEKQQLELSFGETIPAGDASLYIAFSGILNDELAGFYRSKTERGNIAVTQFEATDARRAFPCWDEPACKATFDITVRAPMDKTVLSNGHVVATHTEPDQNRKTWTFVTTPVQSTYLVAIVVGDFDWISQVGPKDGILTSIYTPLGKKHLGQFALKVGVEAMALFRDLFGVPFMAGKCLKCDHIAIADFAAGAMENTGCITYRESALLIDEKQSSIAAKQRVAQVVAHELSHQWFGNLTTMQWWTELWLNEGFAKHCEYVATNAIFPEWRTWDHFTSTVQSAAFGLDSMASTHPIEVEVASPDEVNEVFDLISYNKGASVIRMLFAWLTQDVAFKGLNLYLTRHAFANARTTDLWQAMGEVAGKPLAPIMKNWTAKPGHPFVHISENTSGSGPRYTITSGRSIAPWALNNAAWPAADDFADGPSPAAVAAVAARHGTNVASKDAKYDETNQDWCIPIAVVVGADNGSRTDTVSLGVLALDPDAFQAVALPDGADAADRATREGRLAAFASSLSATVAERSASWIKLNAGHTAFHRTVYDSALLKALLPAVETPADRSRAPHLGVADRLGVVGDVASAVSMGLAPSSDLLLLAWTMRFETEYAVWTVLLEAVGDLKGSAMGVDAAGMGEAMRRFTLRLLQPVLAYVGCDAVAGEDANTPLLRAMVLRLAAMAGDRDVVDKCLLMFDAFAAGQADINADMKPLVYNTAAGEGGEARWNALHAMLRKATLSEEQRRLMTALGRAGTNKTLLERALDLTLTDEIRSQDAVFVVGAVASNEGDIGQGLAWSWFTSRYEELHAKWGGGNFLWASIVGSCSFGRSKQAADEIATFFESRPAGSAERKIRQNLEAIRTRQWRAHVLSREGEAAIVGIVDSLIGA